MPFSMSDSLDSHLTQLKREPIPRLDGRFNAGVWEAIERMRKRTNPSWWAFWQIPGLGLTAASLALVLGVAAAFVAQPATAAVRQPLGLDAFAAEAPHLPSALIGGHR